MYVSQAGHQIDKENLHSKLPFFTTTYLQISTLLDILGKCGNFFALWTLCTSEGKKIDAAVFMFFVLPKFHFHAECRPGGVVNMTWQSPKQAEIIELLLIRCKCKVLLHQPLQLFILWSKNDRFLMHPLKNHPVNTLKQMIALFKIKFDLSYRSSSASGDKILDKSDIEVISAHISPLKIDLFFQCI